MSAAEQVWDAMCAADEDVAFTRMVASAFGEPSEVGEHAWINAFTRALAGDGPLTIRLPGDVARKAEDRRLAAEQWTRDMLAATRRGVPVQVFVRAEALREEVRPGRTLCRAKARALRREIRDLRGSGT